MKSLKTAFIWLLSAATMLILCSCTIDTASVNAPKDAEQPLIADAAPLPSALPVPEPAPEPSPEPTPEPTPAPLLPVSLSEYCIDGSFFEPAAHQGTVITAEYITRDYSFAVQEDVTKQMRVYLPYGYNEDEQYDVLFLAHVMQCDSEFWMDSDHYYTVPGDETLSIRTPVIIDNLIERGMCRPLIVISLDCYISDGARYEHNSPRDYSQFPQEFRNDILPYVRENFAVYDTREHYGFLGASFGSYVEYLCILSKCYDLVGWYALTGGGQVDYSYLYESWSLIGAEELECCLLYFAEGEYDDIGPVQLGYYALRECSKFNDDNLIFSVIGGGCGHEYREWDNCLYNALQLFFRPADER